MGNLLMQYIRLVIESARTPQQLLSPDDSGVEDTAGGSDEGCTGSVEGEVDESSGCASALGGTGTAGFGGYTAPLGMSPDKLGRKKNRKRSK
jgi:hypothetical protein